MDQVAGRRVYPSRENRGEGVVYGEGDAYDGEGDAYSGGGEGETTARRCRSCKPLTASKSAGSKVGIALATDDGPAIGPST